MIQLDHLSPRLLAAEYAVRGAIVDRANELEAAGRKIVYCNIGNPQALQQPPITYLRQLLALVEYPALLDQPDPTRFPQDVVDRARRVLESHAPGTGAYTHSAGLPFIRRAVAESITRRDGIPADPSRVLLTDGASKGAQAVLTALVTGPQDGFLVPTPQYPLYSASLTLLGGQRIDYDLDERQGWQLTEAELTRSLTAAQAAGIRPVGIVVINPGNPTGAVLTRDNIAMVLGFARRHGLAVIADEVYQENVYDPRATFVSFARVLHELGDTDTALFSLHSTSKGFLGECGHRGGYLELRNVPEDVLAQVVKLQSIGLCANVPGQLATWVMVEPPRQGEASHARYVAERDAILSQLRDKARMLGEGLNAIPGLSVVAPQGAMYAFVRLHPPADPPGDGSGQSRPPESVARRDVDWCMALLEETGICVVPGSGFGQQPGTLHFRTTFLPPAGQIRDLVAQVGAFQRRYKWSREVSAPTARRPLPVS